MKQSGHTNRTIDIFKMDCEGCEFDVLPDQVFLPLRNGDLSVRQLLVEMHSDGVNIPYTHLAAFSTLRMPRICGCITKSATDGVVRDIG